MHFLYLFSDIFVATVKIVKIVALKFSKAYYMSCSTVLLLNFEPKGHIYKLSTSLSIVAFFMLHIGQS